VIEQFKVEQFGVAVSGKLDKYVQQLLDLKPDVVQVPFHLFRPSQEACQTLSEGGIRLVGKIIPPLNVRFHLSFLRKLFQDYKGLINIWDFGGEPETKPDQPGCRFAGPAKDFVDEIRLFYVVGKEINPDNLIGGCGWIAPTFNGYFGNEDRSGFFNECCHLGISDFLDFISLNFYTYGYGGTKNIFAGMSKVKEILSWHHIKKPVVVAECGVPCSGDPRFLHIIQTPERQAISLVEQNILFNSIGVDYSIWFSLQWKGWGLIDDTGKPRPSYKAFQHLQSRLRGSKFSRRVKAFPSGSVQERWITDHFAWFVFLKNGEEIHVMWLTGGKKLSRKFKFPYPVYDIYGEKIPTTSVLEIDEAPKYIVAPMNAIHNLNFGLV